MSCSTISSDSIIVFQDGESKSKMCFSNPSNRKITKIRIDNCVITEGKRCDYLLIDHNKVEYFIELKGKQVEYACEQLAETIVRISKDKCKIKFSFVISSACPLTTTQVQILKVQFKKKYNCILKIKNNFCDHILS